MSKQKEGIHIDFIDSDSQYAYLYLMYHHFKTLEKWKEYKAEVENLLKRIKKLWSDRDFEYMDFRF